ncbi:MAG: response regulator transcription factor [Anaerolineae bacterium]|nr:response regulator transcription factor [Anaerolineae bacterium]
MQRILVVDDDAPLRFSITEILGEAGYQTMQAGNGAEGLRVLEQDAQFELVLSDVKMPEMDGLQFIRAIKTRFPDLSVVMLTGHGTIDSAVQAMREGAINYLLKPISKRQLLEGVREGIQIHQERLQKRKLMEQVIYNLQSLGMYNPTVEAMFQPKASAEQSATQSAAVDNRFLQIGELIIDQHRLVALFQGRLLELTPTEFEILYCLMQAGGRVVTFEEIAHRLRGVRMERDEARTMLSSHLTNLRSKLRDEGCEHYLVNSRSNGYFVNIEVNTLVQH